MVKITVKETVAKLKEANPSPKKMYNKTELTQIVIAMMNDPEYVTKHTKVKNKAFVTEDRHLGAEFRKALIDILKGVGLKQAEAEDIANTYKVPKSLAETMIDIVHASDMLYMKEVGKGVKLIGETDAVQTIYMRDMKERSYRIPKTLLKNSKPSEYSSVNVKPHAQLSIDSKVNPNLRKLLK